LILALLRIAAHISSSPFGTMAFIGDENTSRAPANLEWMEQRMPERRRFTQTTSLKTAFAKEATQLRKQAQGAPAGR